MLGLWYVVVLLGEVLMFVVPLLFCRFSRCGLFAIPCYDFAKTPTGFESLVSTRGARGACAEDVQRCEIG